MKRFKNIVKYLPDISRVITDPDPPLIVKPFKLILEGKNFDKKMRLWVFLDVGVRDTHPVKRRLISSKKMEAEGLILDGPGLYAVALDREGAETDIPEALGHFTVYTPEELKAKQQKETIKVVYGGKVCEIKKDEFGKKAGGALPEEAGGGGKPAYQFKVVGQDVWCNDGEPFKAEPRLASILNEFISNPGVEVKMKRLETVSGLTRDSVRDTVRDMVAWLNNTFKIDTKKLDKMFEPIRGRNRKYIAYTYHPDIS